jgi:hypothetical protein
MYASICRYIHTQVKIYIYYIHIYVNGHTKYVHIEFCVLVPRRGAALLQIGWHSTSRLFLKHFQRTRILPMGFTNSTK